MAIVRLTLKSTDTGHHQINFYTLPDHCVHTISFSLCTLSFYSFFRLLRLLKEIGQKYICYYLVRPPGLASADQLNKAGQRAWPDGIIIPFLTIVHTLQVFPSAHYRFLLFFSAKSAFKEIGQKCCYYWVRPRGLSISWPTKQSRSPGHSVRTGKQNWWTSAIWNSYNET